MNSDQVKGKWHQFKGAAKAKWGKLTDDDLDQVAGQSERLIGLVQERYGYHREQAEKEVQAWEKAQHDAPVDVTR